MKKTLLFLGLASMMSAFTGCTKDQATDNNINEGNGEGGSQIVQTITAEFPEDGTRTMLGPDGKSVLWSTRDAIAVYARDAVGRKINYRLDGEGNTAIGQFTRVGTATESITTAAYGKTLSSKEGKGDPEFRYVAVYPADNFVFETFMGGMGLKLGAKIPDLQYYTEGTYDPQALPMMAVITEDPGATTLTAKFKPMASLLHLPVAATQGDIEIEKIEVGANQIACAVLNQFYSELTNDFTSAALRDAHFVSFSTPMDYRRLQYAAPYDSVIEMSQESGDPIVLDKTTKNFYIVVRPAPSPYAPSVKFFLTDGTIITKQTRNKNESTIITPGSIFHLPKLDLQLGEMPTLNVEGDNITWNAKGATKATIQIGHNGITYAGITLDPAKTVTLSADIFPLLLEFIGSAFMGGTTVDITLALEVTTAGTGTTIPPVTVSFDAPVPAINANITEGIPTYLFFNNYAQFAERKYAQLEGDLTVADFASASFQAITQTRTTLTTEYGKGYTVCVKATHGATEVVNLLKIEAAVRPEAKITLALDDYKEWLVIGNYSIMMSAYLPSSTILTWKLSSEAEYPAANTYTWTNRSSTWDNFTAIFGEEDVAPYGVPVDFRVVMTSSLFPDGTISAELKEQTIKWF